MSIVPFICDNSIPEIIILLISIFARADIVDKLKLLTFKELISKSILPSKCCRGFPGIFNSAKLKLVKLDYPE